MATQLNKRMLLYLSICMVGSGMNAAETPIRYNLPPSPPLLACDLERTQSTPIAALFGRLCESPSPSRLYESHSPREQRNTHRPSLYKNLSAISVQNHAKTTQTGRPILERLTVVYGPMFAGKGEFLLTKAAELAQAPDNPVIAAFIHGFIGERQGPIIFSRAKNVSPCEAKVILTAPKLYAKIKRIANSSPCTQRIEVLTDESQFFAKTESPNLTAVIAKLHNKYPMMHFTVAGLNTSFTGDGFGCIPDLTQMAATQIQLRAFCQICQNGIEGKLNGFEPIATQTQRLLNGLPARKNDPLVIPEGSNDKVVYEPRCASCFQAPE